MMYILVGTVVVLYAVAIQQAMILARQERAIKTLLNAALTQSIISERLLKGEPFTEADVQAMTAAFRPDGLGGR